MRMKHLRALGAALLLSVCGVVAVAASAPAPEAAPDASDLFARDLTRAVEGLAAKAPDRIEPKSTKTETEHRFRPITATQHPGAVTCDGTSTCRPMTCNIGPTCDSITCGPGAWTCDITPTCNFAPTCDTTPTCYGNGTCGGGPTCAVPAIPTCGGGIPTCSYTPSCEHYGCLLGAAGVPGPLGGTLSLGAHLGVAFLGLSLLWMRSGRRREDDLVA